VNVTLLPQAEIDLEEIGDLIAEQAPRRAASFVRELRTSALGLALGPLAYPFVPRYERHGIRRRVHGRYVIFYKIELGQIFVLRILHGARDYDRILGGGD